MSGSESTTRRIAHNLKLQLSAAKQKQAIQKKECDKEADEAHASANTDQAEYDKQILTLSTGLLGLSIAFIKDIVPLEQARLLPLLYVAWLFFSLAIVLVLFSFQFSIGGNSRARAYWLKRKLWLEGEIEDAPSFPNSYARFVSWVNRLCGIVFGLGIVLLVAFVVVNVQNNIKTKISLGTSEVKGAQDMKTPIPGSIIQKGQTMKAPPPPPPPPPPPASQTTSSNNSGGKK